MAMGDQPSDCQISSGQPVALSSMDEDITGLSGWKRTLRCCNPSKGPPVSSDQPETSEIGHHDNFSQTRQEIDMTPSEAGSTGYSPICSISDSDNEEAFEDSLWPRTNRTSPGLSHKPSSHGAHTGRKSPWIRVFGLPQKPACNEISMTASGEQKAPDDLLTVFKSQQYTMIRIAELAVEEHLPFGRQLRRQLKPTAISTLSTSVKSTSSPILIIDWNNLKVGTDLSVLPALPPSVETLEILNLPVIFTNKIRIGWESNCHHWFYPFCQGISNGTLKKLVLRSCGYRKDDLTALKKRLQALKVEVHGGCGI